MDNKIMRLTSAVVIGIALIIGMVMGAPVDAAPDPVVPPSFEAQVFAEVTDPFHLAFDSIGNLFVGRDNSGSGGSASSAARIHKVSPDGSTVVEFGDAIDDPDGLIVDIDGAVATLGPNTVLVASLLNDGSGNSRITQISPEGSITSTLVEGSPPALTNPQQLVFDSSGNLLYVNCDRSVGSVGIFDGSNLSVFGSVDVNTCLGGIAVGPHGRVFVSDFDNGKVKVLDSGGNLEDSDFVVGLSSPDAMAFDTTGQFGGKLLVVERANGQIRSIDPATGETEVFATGFARPFGLAFGPDGCLFVSEFDTDTVWRICPAQVQVAVDIKPQSCPNPFNIRSPMVPVAILGTFDFDVTAVDPASIRLLGVAPLRNAFKDIATPFEPFIGKESEFDCTDEGPDGFLDLALKFDTQEVLQAIEAALGHEVEDGEVLILTLEGELSDGTPIVGEDVVVIRKMGRK